MTRRDVLICLLLAGITLGIYWPVGHFDLIYFDDPAVLMQRPEVSAGLTWASVKWALTSVVVANWHPVTNLSFLVTSQFFGTAPGAHHLVNVAFHSANAVLLFLLLLRLTGAPWRSAMVAAIFALHPLRVESVAWIIERKDVLCAFFFLLSLLAYVRFAQKPAKENAIRRRFWNIDLGLAWLAFALALLSKPMAVTLPFVLVLLDVWPLKRIGIYQPKVMPADGSHGRRFDLWPLFLEKWQFFALMILFVMVTYWMQQNNAAMVSWDTLGLNARAANAIAAYVMYPAKLFWPANLAIIYPFPKHYEVTSTLLKAALLFSISIGCLLQFARRPWLLVGWFWYLGMALPVIGLVQVGEQSMADRYTYLPLIGPVVALVWTLAELLSHLRYRKVIAAILSVLILGTLAGLTERQLQFWRNTVTLFDHSIAVTSENASAYYTLGLGLEYTGETRRAILCYRVAKAINPTPSTRQNLANLLQKQGFLEAAQHEADELLAIQPDNAAAHVCLGNIFATQGRIDESLFQFNEAVRLNPDLVEALNNLAWMLATSPNANLRDGSRAVTLAQHACELTEYKKTIFIGTLAAAYAEAGRFDDAIATAQRACEVAQKNGETNLLQNNQKLLERYREHKTARE